MSEIPQEGQPANPADAAAQAATPPSGDAEPQDMQEDKPADDSESKADDSEEATGNDPAADPPNSEQAPMPAGSTQEGGPTVADQAVNALHNEADAANKESHNN